MKPARLGPAWWVVVVVCAIGILTATFGSFRVGGFIIAAGLVIGALERALLPTSMAAGIVIRSRWIDVAFFLIGAAALTVIFAKVQLGVAY